MTTVMTPPESDYCFQQIHIDAARNATDDFNLFHDSNKWNRIQANPFGMPIVLGFQLEALVEYLVTRYRSNSGEDALIRKHQLHFSNYQFTFADVVRPGEPFNVEVRKTVNRIGSDGLLANRVILKKRGGLVLVGFQRESMTPLCMPGEHFTGIEDLGASEDRSWVAQGRYFMKQKFMNTGNGKNFLAGSLVDQQYYFDELEDHVQFPAMFPVALLSCALLEKAKQENYLFEANPAVYTRHSISVDKRLQKKLKSNDRLCLLVGRGERIPAGHGLGRKSFSQQMYRCFGLLPGNRILFRAEIEMAPLQEMLNT